MYKVYFNDIEVGAFDLIESAFKAVSANMKFENINAHYIRYWYDEGKVVIDFGSWSDFYYVYGVSEQDFMKYMSQGEKNEA